MAMRRLALAFAVTLALSAPGAAQLRGAEGYPVERLAQVMGEMHYFDFTCQSRQAQEWRERMAELLEFEAPTRGPYRERLIASFNEGFRLHQRRRTRCGAEAEMARARLALEGEALAERLRRRYID